ncbi:rRNA-binding ribosome biosynthesis protein utp25 [Coelomomyces lativittatus]|nr:rRNA-binding ribosome biosynthesis protein utp25 [Coelomomyces lativittatus]
MSLLDSKEVNSPQKEDKNLSKPCLTIKKKVKGELHSKEDSSYSEDEDDQDENHDYTSHFGDDPERTKDIVQLSQKVESNTLSWSSYACLPPLFYSSILPTLKANSMVSSLTSTFPLSSLSKKVKPRVWTRSLGTSSTPVSTLTLFQELYPKLAGYHDLLYTSPQYLTDHLALQATYCVHVLTHVYRTRQRVQQGDLKTLRTPSLEIRDQGFTRPTVLMLFPFRHMAWNVMQRLAMYSGTLHVPSRVQDEYGTENPMGVPTRRGSTPKPMDYQQVFQGNTDDCFRIGLQVSKSTVKWYTPFYHSDILIASPLGLRTLIEKEKDHDYLSSIDLLVVDGAHIMNAQNWEHVLFIMKKVNQVPKVPGECDFSRVKSYFLENIARHYRQTLIFSEFVFPELLHVFHTYATNLVSGIRFQYRPPTYVGSMVHTRVPLTHTFLKVADQEDFKSVDDLRFKYFVNELLPNYRPSSSSTASLAQKQIVVYFPTYFEYVRVRNYMDQHEYDFEVASEYCSPSTLQRAWTLFQQARTPMLLYTERLHFFKRRALHGACLHVVFYGVPEHPQFYSELVDWIGTLPPSLAVHGSVTSLFTKWDALKLERIVGVERLNEMMGSTSTGGGSGPTRFAYHLKEN